ncbi:MAG: hypothetical protein HY531_01480 [Chloroflexi bacterium]|nr:hypothetical protein [Chloroflexota bacterium]
MRKPKGYAAQEPWDLVQVHTLDVRPLPGVVLKTFTARDVVSRWDVLEAHTRATATTTAGFLDRLLQRMPFPVRAIQVDGGSEFQAAGVYPERSRREQACQEKGLHLFVLPPRSPKLNPDSSGRGAGPANPYRVPTRRDMKSPTSLWR